jgi:hypothetical protein
VEDPLPAYTAVPLNEESAPKDNDILPVLSIEPAKPVTSSLRATNRLLRSFGGWSSNFRGLGPAVVLGLLTLITMFFFTALPFMPTRVAHLLALLVLSPLSTAWTHVVITPPSAKSFFSRIPSARKTYIATALPIFALWSAAHIAVLAPYFLARAIGLPDPLLSDLVSPLNGDGDATSPAMSGSDAAKAICVAGFALGLQVLLVIPAMTALTRVQASLLPADEDTVVPFDRSFGGRVEPEVVSGRGFASVVDALRTVSFASWMRIYMLRIKLFAIETAAYVVMAVVLVAQLFVVYKTCDGSSKCSY